MSSIDTPDDDDDGDDDDPGAGSTSPTGCRWSPVERIILILLILILPMMTMTATMMISGRGTPPPWFGGGRRSKDLAYFCVDGGLGFFSPCRLSDGRARVAVVVVVKREKSSLMATGCCREVWCCSRENRKNSS